MTPEQILDLMSAEERDLLIDLIAANDHHIALMTGNKTLHELYFSSGSSNVRRHLARNPHLSDEMLMALLNDSSAIVRGEAEHQLVYRKMTK